MGREVLWRCGGLSVWALALNLALAFAFDVAFALDGVWEEEEDGEEEEEEG